MLDLLFLTEYVPALSHISINLFVNPLYWKILITIYFPVNAHHFTIVLNMPEFRLRRKFLSNHNISYANEYISLIIM